MLNDIRYGIRSLLKRPGFTIVAIITLALGIGANTAIFSVTDKLLVRALPVREPEQLFLITSVSVNPHFVSNAFSYPDYADYQKQNEALSGLVAFSKTELELRTSGGIERVPAEYVSNNFFEVLGVNAAQGRTFDSTDSAGPQPQVVISDSFRQRRFGGVTNPVGEKVTLNDLPLTVVGVAPQNFGGMTLEKPADIWVPVSMHPQLAQTNSITKRNDRWLQLLGRIKPGVSTTQAETSLDLLAQHVKEANTPPGTITKGLPFSEQHITLEYGGKGISILRQRFAAPLKLLMVVVALVLLIACANVAGLLLARGVARKKEIAIRLSLGANGLQVVRQLLTESLLLALTGGVAGLVLAPWLVSMLVHTQTRFNVTQSLLKNTLDLRVLAFTAVTTVLAGLIFGLLPSWQSSRAQLVPMLKDESGGTSVGEQRHYVRRFLVVGQLSLSIVVLIGAGLCLKSLRNLLAIDPGYRADNLLIVPLDLDEKKYDAARGLAFRTALLEKLQATPGVEGVSYGSVIPFSGSRYMSSLFVEGRQPLANDQMAFDASVVGPRYHETMGVKLVTGRGFTEQDRDGSAPVIIINDTMANRLFPGESAIGRRLTTRTNGPGLEIIGITKTVKHHDLTEAPLPHFDLPAAQSSYANYTNIVLRTKGPAVDLIPSVRNQLLSLDPSLPVMDISAMSEQIGAALAATRLASSLISLFGVVSLLLASLGVYGLMAWLVLRRTRELGIRLALGAQRSNLIGLILRQGLWLTLTGVGVGLSTAFAVSRIFDTQQLYQVKATDTFTFLCVALLLTFVSLLACFIPAVRATRIDPLRALRYE